MRLATWNIYWLGNTAKIQRVPADEARIAAVLAGLDADVLVLQEIVDVEALARIVAQVEVLAGRRYSLDDERGEPLASAETTSSEQKVVLVYDRERLRVEASTRIAGKGRRPLAARLRSVTTGERRLVVGVHLQSGYPVFTDPAQSATRALQCETLANWLGGRSGAEHPRLRSPEADEPVFVAGDFNALWASDEPAYQGLVASLDALRALPGYHHLPLREDPRGGDAVTSFVDRVAIDHVLASAAVGALEARIVAFDVEGAVDGVAPERVSDHRPLLVEG
jgi:endonuclease/exonuclease/phosphatase family metal-dependent hydrolase